MSTPESPEQPAGRALPVLGDQPPAAAVSPSAGRVAGTGEHVVSFVSLGCPKNLVDSEIILARLAEAGAVISVDEELADTVVVNTCGFLAAARDEALAVLRELAGKKRRGELRHLIVAGCLVQRDGQRLLEEVPEIDALVGVNNRDDIVRALAACGAGRQGGPELFLGPYHARPWSDAGRLRLTPQHYAYVRISEGCDQKCTFCTIPAIRGPLHSKPVEQIVAECHELIADGASELLLIGQDTTSYGRDLGYGPGLAGLLRTLDEQCTAARWLRLMYVYPSVLTDEMLDAIAECERIVKYIDIPLQHISDRVLRAMYRRVTRRQTERLLERIRRRIPGVAIRSTFIVGFPGESAAELGELLTFVRDFGFDAVAAFEYSREPDTPAGRMKHQVDEATRRRRYEQLMLAQQEVAFAAARRRMGQRLEVLIDGRDEHGRLLGRHAGQAPEVDAACIVEGCELPPGSFVQVECVGSEGYDLVVRPIET